MSLPELKLVIVGDGAVGKTCLLMSYCTGTFSEEYIPTVFENFTRQIKVKDLEYQILFCDTSGQEDYDRLRPLAYPKTNVFLVCFSVVMPDSFDSAEKRWKVEIEHHCPSVPFILVGTQMDLREDKQPLHTMKGKPVTREEGEKLARKLGAIKYMECSAKTQTNVKELFKETLLLVTERKKVHKKKQCVLL